MASILFYTSPARGHLFPILGSALELNSRGHDVHIRTLSSEIDKLADYGLGADAMAPEIEERDLDDWKGKSPVKALEFTMKTFGDRSKFEISDLQNAIQKTRADLLVIDVNSWGAQAAAEASGLPWAVFQPYFTFLPAPGVPPFGPGFKRSTGIFGKLRDKLLGKAIFSKLNKLALPPVNSLRARLNLVPLSSLTEMPLRPDKLLYFTSKTFEYPREKWPDNFEFVGPGLWSPPSGNPPWLDETARPVVLVTCSTERQNDRPIVEAALQTLPQKGFFVAATTASYQPEEFKNDLNPHTRLERFIPHDPVIKKSCVVICHGGMGVTQRALSHGVPLVVVPFGRDQLEVARRVEFAGAGVMLMPNKLSVDKLLTAVERAIKKKTGAERLAMDFKKLDNSVLTAGLIEGLIPTSVGKKESRLVL